MMVVTQGSAGRATLGWRLESFQDSEGAPGGEGGWLIAASWHHCALALDSPAANCPFLTIFGGRAGFFRIFAVARREIASTGDGTAGSGGMIAGNGREILISLRRPAKGWPWEMPHFKTGSGAAPPFPPFFG